MYDAWQRYGIFAKERGIAKRKQIRKMMKLAQKFRAIQKKQEEQIAELNFENSLKRQLIQKMSKRIGGFPTSKKGSGRGMFKFKPKKIIKDMRKTLARTKKEKKLMREKLRLVKDIKKKKQFLKSTKTKQWQHQSWRNEFIKDLRQMHHEVERNRLLRDEKSYDKESGLQELREINRKIVSALNDITEINQLINYLRKTKCTNFKIKPLVKTNYWIKPPIDQAIVVMDKTSKKRKTRAIKREVLKFQRPYVLERIPELMPGLYSYLNRKL